MKIKIKNINPKYSLEVNIDLLKENIDNISPEYLELGMIINSDNLCILPATREGGVKAFYAARISYELYNIGSYGKGRKERNKAENRIGRWLLKTPSRESAYMESHEQVEEYLDAYEEACEYSVGYEAKRPNNLS